MRELILYTPNKGANFGQAFRERKVSRAAENLSGFLASCTTAGEPDDVRLVAYRATEWDDDLAADRVVSRVIDRFGTPNSTEVLGHKWPSGEALKGGKLVWNREPNSIAEIVTFLSSGEPWPKQTLGPVEFRCHYSFQWIDPDSRSILSGQDHGNATVDGAIRSTLSISLGRSQFAQPHFWFPFPEGSPDLSAYIRRIEPHLPFKFNDRHFRVAVPKNDGSGYVFRKLVVPPTAV